MLDDQIAPRFLTGQLLIAAPGLSAESSFARSVVYVCAHSDQGAMGLVVNRSFEAMTFPDLLEQLGIEATGAAEHLRVHFGGPVESGRGFVLHTPDVMQQGSLRVAPGVALTATIDILKAIAAGNGPRRSLLALGYAAWGPGQLDEEILKNGWLNVSADETLIFGEDLDAKWERAIDKLGGHGASAAYLSSEAGHA